MACIICSIAGTSIKDFFDATRSEVVKSFAFSSVDGYNCPATLEELRQKANLENRCITKGNTTVIDGTIQVTIPEQNDLVDVWNKVSRTATRVIWIATPIGLGALTVGGWKAISDRSILKGLGTLVVVVVSAIFAWHAYFLAKVVRERKEWLQNAPADIAAHRKHVIENWVDAKADEFKTKKRVFELFTAQELELLVNSHADKERKKLYEIEKAVYRRYFECHFDKNSSHYKLFMKRFDERDAPKLYSGILSDHDFVLLRNRQIISLHPSTMKITIDAALEERFIDYKDDYLTWAFGTTFAKVFSREGVDNYDAYIKWAAVQFNNLPNTFKNKPFLIDCLPKKPL
ncbi:MAG: hypothetical protein ABSA17_01080 [Rhabdochlamydiaceae bacterium]